MKQLNWMIVGLVLIVIGISMGLFFSPNLLPSFSPDNSIGEELSCSCPPLDLTKFGTMEKPVIKDSNNEYAYSLSRDCAGSRRICSGQKCAYSLYQRTSAVTGYSIAGDWKIVTSTEVARRIKQERQLTVVCVP